MKIPFQFDDSIPEDERFMAITVNRFAWPLVRKLALRSEVTTTESKGWFRRRFVMRGSAQALNTFAQTVWNDETVGPSFREKCRELGLTK